MAEKPFEFEVQVAPFSDGSGYAAKATVELGDDSKPVVRAEMVYRLTEPEWKKLVKAVETAFEAANKCIACG